MKIDQINQIDQIDQIDIITKSVSSLTSFAARYREVQRTNNTPPPTRYVYMYRGAIFDSKIFTGATD